MYHRSLDTRFINQIFNYGLFWAVGAAEKIKLPTAITMQLFGVVFSTGKKNIKLKKKLSIRTKKLHSIKAKKILKNFRKYLILG